MDYDYESFDVRAENPTRWQSVLNNPDPVVKGDPCAVWLVIACFVVALVAITGLVVFWKPTP